MKRFFRLKLTTLITLMLFAGVGAYIVSRASQQSLPGVTQNPSLTQTCGLDIALVLDVSTSISRTQFTQMKSALTGFVTTFGGGETQFSVTRFANNATVVQGFTNSAAAVNNAINSMSQANGTNWEDALRKAHGSFDPRPDKQNLLIIATDGEPATDRGQSIPVDSARMVANSIKGGGTRILVMGIIGNPNSPSINNMKQISGPSVNTGSVLTSDVITTSFSALAGNLATFANQTCGTDPGPFQGQNQGQSVGPSGGGGGGAAAQKQAPKPNPLPADPLPQGEVKKEEPKPKPSPFFDGKEFEQGSNPDTFANTTQEINKQRFSRFIPVIAGALLLGGLVGFGYWKWRRRDSLHD